jgi:hypothetical protein
MSVKPENKPYSKLIVEIRILSSGMKIWLRIGTGGGLL